MWIHISRLFSKFKVSIQLVEKIMCYRKKRLNLKVCPFISELDFFFVHAVSSFLLKMLLLLIYAEYKKYNLTILLRGNAYNNTLNMKYHNSIKK